MNTNRLLFETWIKDNGKWRRYGFRVMSMAATMRSALRLLDKGHGEVEVRKYYSKLD
jgi:hypothetical protein